jgi:tetratricopeptide (TPR) repeat protein
MNSTHLLAQAMAAQRAGNASLAETLCRAHLAQAPRDAAGLAMLGMLVAQRGELAQGERLLRQAVDAAPAQGIHRFQLGLLLQQAGHDADALAAFDAALAAGLQAPPVHNARGLALKNLARLDEAVAAYAGALALDARFLPALHNRGVALHRLARHAEAAVDFRAALALAPGNAEVLNGLGLALHALGDYAQALESFQRALAAGETGEGRINLAITLNQLHRHAEAEAALRPVLQRDPADDDARMNLATAMAEQGRRDEALAEFRAVLQRRPDHPDVLMNIANTLRDQGRHQEALPVYQEALRLQPGRADLHFNRSLSLLALGRLAEGWPEYEWRWKADRLGKVKREFGRPQWQGEDVRDRTVLVHAEQGLGDTLQISRYVPLLAQRGARVVLEVQPPLFTLMGSLQGVAQLVRQGDPLPAFDLHCPMMSLPLAFGTTLQTIPASGAYLQADQALVERWRAHLAGRGRPQIGVAWSGNPANWNDHRRSVPLERFRAALPAGADYWSLKHEMPELPQDGLTPIHRFAETSFDHMAAQVCALDGVVSICTAVAHLAGALARPMVVLLSRPADWRWFEDSDDNPWYPTARLLRQRESGNWDGVFERLPEALAYAFRRQETP